MRTTTKLGALLLGLVGMTATGCSGATGPGTETPGPADPEVPALPPEVPTTPQSLLRHVQSCDELLGAIKADALQKMNEAIDAQIEQTRLRTDGQFGGGGLSAGNADEASAPSSAGSAPGSGASGGASPPPTKASDFSETNTQVKGVDEADIVKADGARLYVLHGRSLQIVNAWPAANLAAAASLEIEGNPSEMFLAGDRAVVFSAVDGAALYRAAGVVPRQRYAEPYGAASCYGGCGPYAVPVVKATVVALAGAQPSVERELYFEGTYASSRRVGDDVRVVVNGAVFGPQLRTYPDWSKRQNTTAAPTPEETIAAYEALRVENVAALERTTLEAWLPYAFTKSASGVAAELTSCAAFHVPSQGTTQMGVAQVAAFNLADPTRRSTTAVLGAVDTVYASEGSLVLAARAWVSPKRAIERPEGRRAPFVDFLPSTATYLHKFDLAADPSAPKYVASGVVPGHVLNQFSIDERDGALRVATSEQRTTRTFISDDRRVRPFVNAFPVNHVVAVRQEGASLRVIGSAGDLAPGERVYSARFVGDKGYVVTFRQVDPLFVVDLADARKPRVLGELKIPGFSEYMHPLDDGHLLTIGRDTENGARRGLALQIFDVTQPTQPRLAHKHVFDGAQYGYSEAEGSAKAFTYFAARGLLTFPYYAYGPSGFRTSAELFKVDAAAGFTRLGSVDHTGLFGAASRGYCGGTYGPQVRRGVFFEDVLFSISYGGIVASDTKDLAAPPLAKLALAAPTAEPGRCGP